MQPNPQSICAIVCIYVCFGPTQRLLPGVLQMKRKARLSSSFLTTAIFSMPLQKKLLSFEIRNWRTILEIMKIGRRTRRNSGGERQGWRRFVSSLWCYYWLGNLISLLLTFKSSRKRGESKSWLVFKRTFSKRKLLAMTNVTGRSLLVKRSDNPLHPMCILTYCLETGKVGYGTSWGWKTI